MKKTILTLIAILTITMGVLIISNSCTTENKNNAGNADTTAVIDTTCVDMDSVNCVDSTRQSK